MSSKADYFAQIYNTWFERVSSGGEPTLCFSAGDFKWASLRQIRWDRKSAAHLDRTGGCRSISLSSSSFSLPDSLHFRVKWPSPKCATDWPNGWVMERRERLRTRGLFYMLAEVMREMRTEVFPQAVICLARRPSLRFCRQNTKWAVPDGPHLSYSPESPGSVAALNPPQQY